MAKTIAFPISKDKWIKSLPVAFPERCVICGKEKQNTLPVTVEQKQTRGNKTFSLPLGLIHVPYCEEHSTEIEASEEKTEKIQETVFSATFLLLVIPLFWILYRPIYEWGVDALMYKWGRLPASVGSFIANCNIHINYRWDYCDCSWFDSIGGDEMVEPCSRS